MKRKALLVVLLLVVATIVPLIAIQVQGLVSAGPPQTAYVGQPVTFNGSSTENYSSIVSVTWDFGDGSALVNGSVSALNTTAHAYAAPAVYNVTLTVKYSTALNKTENASTTVTVLQNLPPVANAGPDQVVEQTSPAGAMVKLNGTGSFDPNNDTLTYSWTWAGGSASGVTPTVLFPAGKTVVTLTVSDGLLSASDTVNITVRDTTPPSISVSVNPSVLWPPDHKYAEISATVSAQDVADPSPKITLVSVKSSEPDNANGDGNTVNDVVIVDKFTFQFRSERAGTGMGRTYTITYVATDASGNSATATATVTVPHNQ